MTSAISQAIYLMLSVTTITADHDITNRDIFLPFPSLEACETARKGALMWTKGDTITGQDEDVAACMSPTSKEDLTKDMAPWPKKTKR